MNLNLKQKRIIVAFFTIILLGIIAGVIIYNKGEKDSSKLKKNYTYSRREEIKKEASGENLSVVQKKILDVDEESKDKESPEKAEEKQYTEMYKEFLALPEKVQEKSEVVPRKQEVTWVNLNTIKKIEDESFKKSDEGKKIEEQKNDTKKDDSQNKQNNELPSRYNLADKIKIDIRNQGGFGLCWDFAAMKALETHLAVKNIGNYDFSEIHVDYIESNLLYGYREVHNGANFTDFEDYLAISGVVPETAAPYREHTPEEYNKFIDMESPITVTETVQFPSVHKFLDEDDTYSKRYTDAELKEYRDAIKKHIMANGGLYCYIAAPDTGTVYFNKTTSAEYCELMYSDIPRGVHAMTIVGWDDNYSKDNFNSGMRPKKDGAYIAVNSWGPERGDNGYYYISYEDRYVEEDINGIVSTSMDSTYKIEEIKNPGIKSFLKDNYSNFFIKYNGEDYISKLVLSKITNLDLTNRGLTSLDGIEIFSNAHNIDISNNSIKDISPLKNFEEIWSLDLSGNEITDISCLNSMDLEYLYYFDISNNKISDVSVLANILKNVYIRLDLSNNPGVKGYETIPGVSELNLSNCNIKDISNLENCVMLNSLDVSKNPGITGFESLPNSISSIYLSECGLTEIPNIPDITRDCINHLDISKNNITSLNGIEDFALLYSLDVSENPITDWNALSLIEEKGRFELENDIWDGDDFEGEFDDEEDGEDEEYDYYNLSIRANKCNISDISIFNEIKEKSYIELRDNNISDFSVLNSSKILGLDISGNKNIKAFPETYSLRTLMMDNCGLSSIDNLPDYTYLNSLDLSNNSITDINKLSNYEKIEDLSIANNKNVKGTISNKKLYVLNINDCDLKDGDINIQKNKIGFIKFGGNKELDISKIIEKSDCEFITIHTDELPYGLYEELENKSDRYVYVDWEAVLTIDYPLDSTGKVDFSLAPNVKKELMRGNHFYGFKIVNGKMEKNRYIIDVMNNSANSIKIDYDYKNDILVRFGENPAKTTTTTVPITTVPQTTVSKTTQKNENTNNVNNINNTNSTNNTNNTNNSNSANNTNNSSNNNGTDNGNTETDNTEKNKTDVVGTWNISSAEQDGEEVSLGSIFGSGIKYGGSINLNSDGSYSKYIGITSEEQEDDLTGTYIYEGNKILFTSNSGMVEVADIEDGKIKLKDSNGYILFFIKSN